MSALAVKDLPRLLAAAGVLVTDWQFTRGTSEGPGRCREFALGPAHRDAPLVPVPVAHEADEVADAFAAAHGLLEVDRRHGGEWAALLLRRAA